MKETRTMDSSGITRVERELLNKEGDYLTTLRKSQYGWRREQGGELVQNKLERKTSFDHRPILIICSACSSLKQECWVSFIYHPP